MKLLSKDIQEKKQLDSKFTCDGADIHPHLKWYEEPTNTKSFAISFINIDHSKGIWSHWYVCNIPNEVKEILQGEEVNGMEIENDFGTLYYEGPCSTERHRYVFTVYALKIISLKNLNSLNFRKEVQVHCLDRASITVIYQRKMPDRIFI